MLDDEDECFLEGLRSYEVMELISFFNEHGTPDISQTVRFDEPQRANFIVKECIGPQRSDALVAYPMISQYTITVSRSDVNKIIHIDLVPEENL